jgi:hypothetical protein
MIDLLTDIEASEFPIPSVEFLGGPLGKSIDDIIQEKYGTLVNRVGYNPKSGLVEGSTPFYVSAANHELRKYGYGIATPADLEYSKFLNTLNGDWCLDTQGFYEDTALVVRGKRGPNWELAEGMLYQMDAEPERSIVIPLNMTYIDEGEVPTLKLKKYAQVFETNILDRSGHFKSGDVDLQSGLPRRKNERGDRFIYGQENGMSRLLMGTGSCLVANVSNMEGTNPQGRIVIVKS